MHEAGQIGRSGDTAQEGLTGEDESRKFLVFRVGDFWLALPIEVLNKVHDAESVPPRTPNSKVLDLHRMTGAKLGAQPAYWIDMEAGKKRYLMPVEAVEEIRELSLALPMPYPGALRKKETAFLKSIYFDGLRMIVEMDPAKLAEVTESMTGITSALSERRERPVKGGTVEDTKKEDKKSSVNTGRMLVFEAGEKRLAIDLDIVVQIINRDEIHPVPAAGQKIMGVVYHADQAVPVLSFDFLKANVGGEDDFEMIIVAETKQGFIAFVCRKVLGVMGKEEFKKEAQANKDDADRDIIEIGPQNIAGHL